MGGGGRRDAAEARFRRAAAAVVSGANDRMGPRHPARPANPAARLDATDRGGGHSPAARNRIARSRQTHLGAGLSRAVGENSRGSSGHTRTPMRVTMLVRCLAMMRGGGETRHLAWARELAALGVDVDIISGIPLVSGVAGHPVDGVDVDLVRSPCARDFVYRWQNRRGFGRLTMTALHVDEEWFCRAAWRHIAASPQPADVVHAHAIHQAARLRVGDVPVVINLPGPPNRR